MSSMGDLMTGGLALLASGSAPWTDGGAAVAELSGALAWLALLALAVVLLAIVAPGAGWWDLAGGPGGDARRAGGATPAPDPGDAAADCAGGLGCSR